MLRSGPWLGRSVASVFILVFCPITSSAAASFRRDVAPTLVERCLSCHNTAKAKGDYQLQTAASFLKPGGSAEAPVVAGHPEKSKIFQLITTSDPADRMPQKSEPLSSAQVELIKKWIEAGAEVDVPETALLESLVPRVYPAPPQEYPRPVPILALAFSPDGKILAAGGYHELLFLDPRNGTVQSRIAGLPQQTSALSFSPDGQHLAAACGSAGQVGEFVLINPGRAQIQQRLHRIGDQALATAFSPDGKSIATGGADNLIRIFDLASGQMGLVVEPHTDWIMALTFTRDGSKLVSASRDKTVRVLDATTGEVLTSYLEHQAAVFALAVSSDNRHVFSAGRDKTIHQWDLGTAKKVREISGAGGDIYQLRVEGETLLASSADRLVRLYRGNDKPSLVHTLSGHQDYVFALAFDPGRKLIASGSFDGEVRLWDATSGQALTNFMAAPGLR